MAKNNKKKPKKRKASLILFIAELVVLAVLIIAVFGYAKIQEGLRNIGTANGKADLAAAAQADAANISAQTEGAALSGTAETGEIIALGTASQSEAVSAAAAAEADAKTESSEPSAAEKAAAATANLQKTATGSKTLTGEAVTHLSTDEDPNADADAAGENEGVSTNQTMKGYTNVALVGIDTRDISQIDYANSDTMIVASINNDTGKVRMVSIYRDTLLNIQDSYSMSLSQGDQDEALGGSGESIIIEGASEEASYDDEDYEPIYDDYDDGGYDDGGYDDYDDGGYDDYDDGGYDDYDDGGYDDYDDGGYDDYDDGGDDNYDDGGDDNYDGGNDNYDDGGDDNYDDGGDSYDGGGNTGGSDGGNTGGSDTEYEPVSDGGDNGTSDASDGGSKKDDAADDRSSAGSGASADDADDDDDDEVSEYASNEYYNYSEESSAETAAAQAAGTTAAGRYDKANAAYANGSTKQLLQMLNKNLDLNIHDIIVVDFSAVAKLVDDIGGIDVWMTFEECTHMNNYCQETSKVTGLEYTPIEPEEMPRDYHLNGVQAVSYARIRYTAGNDMKRTQRQRVVIQKVVEKAKQRGLDAVTGMIRDVLPMCKTSFSTAEIIKLATQAFGFEIEATSGFPFEHIEKNIYVGSKQLDAVIPVTLEDNVKELHEFLFDDEDYECSATVKEYSNDISVLSGLTEASRDVAKKNSVIRDSGGEADVVK